MSIIESVVRFFAAMAIAAPVYILIRFVYLRRKSRICWGRELLRGLFFVYLLGLSYLSFRPGPLGGLSLAERLNLLPLHSIVAFAREAPETFLIHLAANVLMFTPIGLCLPLLWKGWQKLWKVLLAGLCFSLLIETAQIFLARSVDIDDVILNVAGVVMGYGLFVLGRKMNLDRWSYGGKQEIHH